MVVIIDDRGDVWEYSPNLVRVVACEFRFSLSSSLLTVLFIVEFFVGTGDINSSFLPKRQSAAVEQISTEPSEEADKGENSPEKEDGAQVPEDIDERKSQQIAEVAKQLEERPLAKAQEQLEERQHAPTSSDSPSDKEKMKSPNEVPIIDVKPVLNENDRELDRVESLLCETHKRFYERHDARLQGRALSPPDVSVRPFTLYI
jgi:RNA polymerase II subunit A C-terminal domain phosphatase